MTWLFAAYSVVWIAIFIYVFSLDRRQKALSNEVEALRSKLSK